MSQNGKETDPGGKRVGAFLTGEYWEKWNRLMSKWRWNQRDSLEHMIDEAYEREFPAEEEQRSA